MRAQAFAQGAMQYASFLLRTLLFPFIWMWALALARKHSDTDTKAVPKIVGGLVAGVVLGAIAFTMVTGFASDATDGMYDTMDGRLSQATGEAAYQDQLGLIMAAEATMTSMATKVADAQAEGDEENATIFQLAYDNAQATRDTAQGYADALFANHELYLSLAAPVAAQNDGTIKQLIYTSNVDAQVPTSVYDQSKMDSRTAKAFSIKDSAQDDLAKWMNFMLLPGLIGVFFAPLSFAVGNVLKNAWEPSDSVGFKPYPGASMGFFLLFGAFGLPALFFAAWTFWDMDVRSKEGQISL